MNNPLQNFKYGTRDHQIFKYFTGPPMETAKGTTTETTATNQNGRNKAEKKQAEKKAQ